MNNITKLTMDLMDKYEWLTAAIARYVIEKNIDIDYYAANIG